MLVPTRANVTAFVNVTVVPMDRERVLPDQTVVIDGTRIVALGPAARVRVPAGAVRIDGRGKFLMPGLADMHAHVPNILSTAWPTGRYLGGNYPTEMLAAAKHQLVLYVASGVTTIRDMWERPEALDLRAQAATGVIVSPRMYVAAQPVDAVMLGLLGAGLTEAAQLDSIVRYVETVKHAGFDFLKMYGEHGPELDSTVAVAHRVGLPIAGHVPENCSVTPCVAEDNQLAAKLGYASVEHLLGLWEIPDDSLHLVGAALQQAGVWVCPTLNHMVQTIASGPSAWTDTATLYRTVRTLRDVGVGLLAGTDALAGPQPGGLVSDELARLVVAGLTPYDALQAATRNPAVYFGTLDSTGTVAVGKRSDLVLLAGNPLADIHHVANPVGVMLGGRWLSRAKLEQIKGLPDSRPPLPNRPPK